MNNMDINHEENVEWKLYHRRWFMLFIFVFFSMGSSSQWIQYSIIANLITKYYNVENSSVDWTSIVYMVAYIPLIFPASHFLDKVGLRWPMILGTFANAAGACVKIASASRNLFWVTFIGQTICALAQVFMLSVPPIFAAIWFGEKEVSTACSIGVFGNMFGIVLGFLIPTLMVQDHEDPEEIGDDLRTVFYMYAGFNVTVFIFTVLFFQAKPPIPPSPQQAMQKQNAAGIEVGNLSLLKRLMLNKNYVILLVSYCLNQSVLNSLSTLVNQIVIQYSYKDAEEFGGRIGVILIAAGLVGTIVFGVILDKTRWYKLLTFIVYASSLVGMIAVTYTLPTESEIAVYCAVAFFGFFVIAYVPIAYDFAVEVTYPEPESLTSGFLTFIYQIASCLATLGYGELVRSIGAEWSNNILSILLLIGTVLHVIIKPDLKRQAAYTSTMNLTQNLEENAAGGSQPSF